MSLNGFDVASYQAGMNVGKVAGDFVLVKATEGIDYTNPEFNGHAKQTLSAGKKLGVYHFIRNNSDIKQQADYFLTVVKPYIGKAMLVLDFENTTGSTIQNQAGVGLAKQWLDYVYIQTGVRPIVYTGINCENVLNWDIVVNANYGLWIAQYNNYDAVNGYQPRDLYGSLKNWKTAVMFQYTSTGRLPGWSGDLDFDVFYGDKSAWDKYAKATKMVTNKSIVQKATTKDGVWTITNEVGTWDVDQTKPKT
ncbi:GH25 family lysozyme [Lactiplantibacillus plantarum]